MTTIQRTTLALLFVLIGACSSPSAASNASTASTAPTIVIGSAPSTAIQDLLKKSVITNQTYRSHLSSVVGAIVVIDENAAKASTEVPWIPRGNVLFEHKDNEAIRVIVLDKEKPLYHDIVDESTQTAVKALIGDLNIEDQMRCEVEIRELAHAFTKQPDFNPDSEESKLVSKVAGAIPRGSVGYWFPGCTLIAVNVKYYSSSAKTAGLSYAFTVDGTQYNLTSRETMTYLVIPDSPLPILGTGPLPQSERSGADKRELLHNVKWVNPNGAESE
jgi:hypothetical protein